MITLLTVISKLRGLTERRVEWLVKAGMTYAPKE